jgi:hypothetical protein
LKIFQIVFYRICNNWRSHQQYIWLSFSSHPHQHLLIFVLLIIVFSLCSFYLYDLFLGSLFCSLVCVSSYADVMLFLLLWLCSIFWNQVCVTSSIALFCSKLHWLFSVFVFHVNFRIVCLVLWRMSFKVW